ncbi:osmolarity sensor protein EnvZ [mine drainage metagenome]|uniref:histidine kinase n=1 Tax=mine drainage metagenome TaxID=410659 RepID=A0A1J5RQ58_9ZZZZ
MRRFADSLYARLALVLLVALGASYAAMYFLFLAHLEDTRNVNIARFVAQKVQLIEELLDSRPDAELPPLSGLQIAAAPPTGADRVPARTLRFVAQLREHLVAEMGREVELIPVTRPAAGLWIRLRRPSTAGQWLLMPMPPAHSSRGISLRLAMLVGFAVFFAGGMILLWQIQRPLKRLGRALETVGHSPSLDKLPRAGVGEIRILGERYNDMVERLHRYEEDRATMLAGVAHDLRSPITRLRLLLELEQGSRSGDMLQNIDDIERITEQFLVYARGSDDEPIEERDAGLLVEEVVAPYREQGVTSRCEHEGLIVAVRANSLRRTLINLIDNAIEYGRPPVVVRVSRVSGEVAIAVHDAGDGIDPDQMAQALRPFSRLDSSRSGKGHCGLGLVIATKIVEEHQGRLQLGNPVGGGFVAEILLPARHNI